MTTQELIDILRHYGDEPGRAHIQEQEYDFGQKAIALASFYEKKLKNKDVTPNQHPEMAKIEVIGPEDILPPDKDHTDNGH